VSPHAPNFLLKGALLFLLWHELPHRPTRDADLLGFGAADVDSVVAVFREVCAVYCADGMHFDTDTIHGEVIRKQAGYGVGDQPGASAHDLPSLTGVFG